jgi:membrane-associated phospholipid phosphatase
LIYGVAFSSIAVWLINQLATVSDQLSLRINSLAGHSWIFDNLVALGQENDLVKAAVIGCCFCAAWYAGTSPTEMRASRKILITTVIASVFVLGTTKTLSHIIFLPRPAIQSQKIYRLEGDQLVLMKQVQVHVPSDESSRKDHEDLVSGNVQTNDLGSFPSDHAGFFIVISLGIWLASRRIGWIALGWTVFVILAGKVIQGEHTLLDVAAGALVAIAGLALFRRVLAGRLGQLLDRVTLWTVQHNAVSSALLFACAFEVSSTLTHVRGLAALALAFRRHIMFGIN